MVPTRRARKDEQKEERRQDILDAAWALFQEMSYPAVTMAHVADRTGLAKGTLYLYFKTKEELFLELIDQELAKWFDQVSADLARFEGAPASTIAALLARSLDDRPHMTRLVAILHAILEYNVDTEAALRFKRSLLGGVLRTGASLERCLPYLAPGEGARLLLRIHALVIGLQQISDPAPAVREILDRPDMEAFRLDFAKELRASIDAFLCGLERAAAR